MGLGWLWGQRCRKEGLFPWTACLPRMGGGQGERRTPGQMLWGGGGALVLVPHPPFWAVGKKSSLIGSLAVSFTLNVRVKQKSQASLLAGEER